MSVASIGQPSARSRSSSVLYISNSIRTLERRRSEGRTQVRICRAEACQAVGSQALTEAVEGRFDVELGATTADGEVTIDDDTETATHSGLLLRHGHG